MAEQPTPREAELMAEVARLTAEDARLTGKNARLTAETEQQRIEIRLLREKVDLLVRKVFGAQSEKLDPAQMLLLLQGLEELPKPVEPVGVEAPRRSKAPSPPRERGPRWPADLKVVEEVIDPEPVKGCPQAWRCIGQEVTEQLDYEPARFFKRRIVRRKYVPQGNPYVPPIIAPLETLLERGIAGPGLLASILVGKFVDHLPLYRLQQIFWTRHRVELPRQTMAQWVGLAADWLRPIYETIRTGVLGGGYVQIDETPIRYLEPGNGRTKLGYLWTCTRPGFDSVFHWAVSRAAENLRAIIPEGWGGIVQADAFGSYPAFARDHNARGGCIRLAGCLAHARREFFEALETAPRHCAWVLTHICALYEIEAQLRERKAGARLRQAVRSADSAPILRRLRAGLEVMRPRYLPRSAMGKAISYTLAHWEQLLVYLEDGRIEIDNNLVENAIRPTALGKKNWLFVGAAHAGDRPAILYTILESCRRRGIDPVAYLRDVFTRMPRLTNRQLEALTPEAWQKAQRQRPPMTDAA